ncbi:MAG: metallopeptidase family protein [Gaiellaceae bacterium]
MTETEDDPLRLFEEVVERALNSLPEHLAEAVSNVQIVIEEEHPSDRHIYGFYTGVPLTERGSGYAGALPDKISIYRRPLHEDFGHDRELLEEEIRITVLHELGHHFGIDEDRLHELGWS